jgi:hypothetical protein
MGELTKTDNAGKMSPGPVYMYQDNIKYDHVSILIYSSKLLLLRHRDGLWVQKLELEKINQDTILMKMHYF